MKKPTARKTAANPAAKARRTAIDKEIVALIEEAPVFAKASSLPAAADFVNDVYVSY